MKNFLRIVFTLAMLYMLLPETCMGQSSNKDSAWAKAIDMLYQNFPHNVTFLHSEAGENFTDLYYRYYEPDVKIHDDLLYLSYVLEYKEHNDEAIFEKVVWLVPLKCIIECNVYQFTFCTTDKFTPSLNYWAITSDTDCGMVKKKVYDIKKVDLNSSHPFQEIEQSYTEESAYAKFPRLNEPNKKELRYFKTVIRQNKKS